jgi:hypothetical protein
VSGQTGTLVIRPRKIRRVCFIAAPVVAVFFAVLATALRGPVNGQPDAAVFQPADQVAMVVLGLFVAAVILMFARPRVVADAKHIEVRNILGEHSLPWAVVRKIVFERGNPWVSLELEDDDRLAVMAVQATDHGHAVEAVRALRALHAAARDSAVS